MSANALVKHFEPREKQSARDQAQSKEFTETHAFTLDALIGGGDAMQPQRAARRSLI
jgi:hypothetical protein